MYILLYFAVCRESWLPQQFWCEQPELPPRPAVVQPPLSPLFHVVCVYSCAMSGGNDDVGELSNSSSEFVSDEDYAWIPWFTSLKGNEFFTEVDDGENLLYGTVLFSHLFCLFGPPFLPRVAHYPPAFCCFYPPPALPACIATAAPSNVMNCSLRPGWLQLNWSKFADPLLRLRLGYDLGH